MYKIAPVQPAWDDAHNQFVSHKRKYEAIHSCLQWNVQHWLTFLYLHCSTPVENQIHICTAQLAQWYCGFRFDERLQCTLHSVLKCDFNYPLMWSWETFSKKEIKVELRGRERHKRRRVPFTYKWFFPHSNIKKDLLPCNFFFFVYSIMHNACVFMVVLYNSLLLYNKIIITETCKAK